MAAVVGEHWPAARLRDVADQEAVPADLLCVFGEPLDKVNGLRMAPVALA